MASVNKNASLPARFFPQPCGNSHPSRPLQGELHISPRISIHTARQGSLFRRSWIPVTHAPLGHVTTLGFDFAPWLGLPGYCGDGVRLEQALVVFERLIRAGVFLFFSLYQAGGHPAHTPALLRD